MTSSGQASVVQDDWDRVWQDYDRRRRGKATPPQPVAAQAPAAAPAVAVPSAPRRGGRRGGLLALACCLLLASQTNVHEASSHPSAAEAFASLLSLAPEEAELPPLTAAVSRLAVESSAAACWVLQLAPQNHVVAQVVPAGPARHPALAEPCPAR